MSDKDTVRGELSTLKQKYRRFKNISTTFPYRFSIDFVPQDEINVDFDGVKISFAIPEKYPHEPPIVEQVETATNGRPIPRVVLQHLSEALNAATKRIYKPGNVVLTQIMQYLENNIQNLITGNPRVLQAYIIDEFDGSSKRRYAFVADTPVITKSEKAEVHKEGDESSNEESDDGYESDESDDTGPTLYSLQVQPPSVSSHSGPNDVCLVFEGVDMKQISVFECTELNLVAHCNRCDHPADVKNLTPTHDFMHDCSNCTKQMEMHFYPHAIMAVSLQQQNIFAHIECAGCTLFDTLPTCKFAGLCFECSHMNDLDSIKLRAANDVECRNCHANMSLVVRQLSKLPAKNFVQEEGTQGSTAQQALRKKKKPVGAIGITPGTPLPHFGTCKHYKHSQRWLRFPCCGKAYPCDICHEEACTLAGEEAWANRMICGHCSTEQSIAGTCKACNKSLTKRRAPGESGVPKKGRSALQKKEGVKIKVKTKSKIKSGKRKI
jgi:hypothetical protein